jgi:hypothetical protein
MRTSGMSFRTGLVLIAVSAFLMQGCAAAVVATAVAGGGMGYVFSQEKPETIASAAPSATGEPESWGQPAAESEPSDIGQPVVLVEPQAPIESVEVQPIQ